MVLLSVGWAILPVPLVEGSRLLRTLGLGMMFMGEGQAGLPILRCGSLATAEDLRVEVFILPDHRANLELLLDPLASAFPHRGP